MPAAVPLVHVRVPAKLNLHLGVGPLRGDGYHELLTVFQAVSITDEVHASPATSIQLSVRGDLEGSVPTGRTNLAWRAAELVATRARTTAGVALEITKTIPVAGGMAGGSADAAAALLACARLWDTRLSATELDELAAQLGSDVNFALLGGTAMGTGRGERLTPTAPGPELHWVFALAGYGIAAGAAYAELDRLRALGRVPGPAGPPERLLAALRDADADAVGDALHNDLQAAALSLRPELADVLAAGRAAGARAALVSGSGPTCAFLCVDAIDAERLATNLVAAGACPAARAAHGPVPGARVVA